MRCGKIENGKIAVYVGVEVMLLRYMIKIMVAKFCQHKLLNITQENQCAKKNYKFILLIMKFSCAHCIKIDDDENFHRCSNKFTYCALVSNDSL